MFTLTRNATPFTPDHKPAITIGVQGQIPNPMSLEEAGRLAVQLKGVLGPDWPWPPTKAPSVADLDAVADEAKAKAATAAPINTFAPEAPAKAKGPWGKKQ